MPRARTAKTVVREIDRSYKNARKLIKQGMDKTTPGTIAFLNHVRALVDLDQRFRQERSERGVDPKDLGTATKTRYVFTSTVLEDDFQDKRTAGERLMVEQLDAEFA